MAVPDTVEARIEILKAIHELMLQSPELQKFDPNQPRVPAGNRDGGQWTSGHGSVGAANRANIIVAARSRQLESQCDAQYNSDIALCRMVGTSLCYQSAMARYVACMGGTPPPPLQF